MHEKKGMRVLRELMQNAKQSDRNVALATVMSQPTVTRTRRALEDQRIIEGYEAIPNLHYVGVEILAICTIGDKDLQAIKADKRIIFAAKTVNGIVTISGHPNYNNFDNFAQEHFVDTYQLFNTKRFIKPFSFKDFPFWRIF